MDFFNDAVNKTKEVFETVSKKTGEVITTEKHKFNMASIETKRDKDFIALGKIYFEMIKDDDSAEEQVKEIVENIKSKTDEIERLSGEIQSAKNKLICPKCGASIDKNSLYCNICGEKIYGGE